jgi:hypothetical protein
LILGGGVAAVALSAAGGVGVQRWLAAPSVTPAALLVAMSNAIANGQVAPGLDPICVANGIAYDQEPVNVQTSNTATLSWMNVLVEAGLYQSPTSGESGGFLSEPISIYRPLPELVRWGGGRRLCVARGVRLESVSNVGRIEDMRLRGKRYTGVLADVRWTLEQPAPWLALPGVSEALAGELPGWRSARWHTGPHGWALTQRKSFVLVEDRWTAGDAVERAASTRGPDQI